MIMVDVKFANFLALLTLMNFQVSREETIGDTRYQTVGPETLIVATIADVKNVSF